MPSTAACILAIRPDQVAGVDVVHDLLATAATAGFDSVLWQPDRSLFDSQELVPEVLLDACRASGLSLDIELDLSRFPLDHALVESHPDVFAIRRFGRSDEPVDPRAPLPAIGEARARLRSVDAFRLLRQPMLDHFQALFDRGLAGIRLADVERIAPEFVAELIRSVREANPNAVFIANASDLARPEARALHGAGLEYLVSSYGWWDMRAPWLVEEYEELRTVAPLLSELRVGVLGEADDPAAIARRLAAAAAVGNGIIVPVGLLSAGQETLEAVRHGVDLAKRVTAFPGEMRRLAGPDAPVTALLRCDAPDVRQSRAALLVLINRDLQPRPAPAASAVLPLAGADFQPFEPLGGNGEPFAPLAGGEVRLLSAKRGQPIRSVIGADGSAVRAAAESARLVVEDVKPRVDGGDFAVKRIIGESVSVKATMFADGHEQLAAELLWRASDEGSWHAARMEQLPNDLWRASFPLERLGRYEFAVEGWLDLYGGFRRDFRKKLDAGVAQLVDHDEGRALVEAARKRAGSGNREALSEWLDRLADVSDAEERATLLLSPELAQLMDSVDHRPHRLRAKTQRVDAERLAARFSSWYELFPRSQTDDLARHGTLTDVIARLPAIREMGFDTLYFPPIHPIGKTNRKGPNNTLTPGPEDPGSPYAIGSADGGHDAIHPELGGFADFARLIEAARTNGLEVALDFAIQCSPDHPWLKEHPGWFAWRPDGSMKYAENPPKKYQDIVNVDFYAGDSVPNLWLALRDVVLLWVEHGVKTFRVDNPHTKPLPFWEWMIGEVRAAHPETIFLAEAFTRPSMMYRLAKIGFSQSYTYFTWRNEKQELTEYITELTTMAPKEFYRPHFFVNTPDINPIFLQTSGRPGFRIRAVLAATLSGLFGVYSGFELCEAAPVPGKEEYLNSEKYELRPRDWQAPGNIIADITLLNRLRRAYPALQTHLNTRFHVAHNEQIIYYAKPAPDGTDMILVMVSLDPHRSQETEFEVPLWEFGLPDEGSVAVENLASGHRFRWQGKFQSIRLDPDEPYRIWRIAPGEDA